MTYLRHVLLFVLVLILDLMELENVNLIVLKNIIIKLLITNVKVVILVVDDVIRLIIVRVVLLVIFLYLNLAVVRKYAVNTKFIS